MRRGIKFFLALFFLLIMASWLLPSALFYKRVLPGVYLEKVPLGGLTREELRGLLKNLSTQLQNNQLSITFRGNTRVVSYRELGLNPDWETTARKAEEYGKKGWLWKRWVDYYHLTRGEAQLNFDLDFDREKAYETLTFLTKDYIVEPMNAQLHLTEDDQIQIIPAVWGSKPDLVAALDTIERNLVNNPFLRPGALNIPEITIEPDITTEELESFKITGKIAEKVTRFNPAHIERTHNIKLATEKLDNVLLPPGGLFSFNETVGPRTKEAGYLESLIIVNNQFEPGLGGGVCQVSSTLYNAALEANLKIVERYGHSLVIDYVPPGLDATVAYGFLDLKFQNNSPGYIWIRAQVEGDALTIKLFGYQEKIPEVEIIREETVLEPKTEIIKDSGLPAGKVVVEREGKRGYQVNVIRVVKEGGISRKEIISQDLYPPQNKKVRMGVGTVTKEEKEKFPVEEEGIEGPHPSL